MIRWSDRQQTRGEFNNASARRALVDWYRSLFITCKAGHQYNERPRALALLNLPQANSRCAKRECYGRKFFAIGVNSKRPGYETLMTDKISLR